MQLPVVPNRWSPTRVEWTPSERDAIARELQPHFHVMAPDLRGHGDSEWARGSSYSLTDHVYDLTRLVHFADVQGPTIIGHSLGGMISLAYAGTYPERVSRLAILDGAFLSGSGGTPIHEQMSRWIGQLDRIGERQASTFRTIEEAAQRLSARNKRLTAEQARALLRSAGLSVGRYEGNPQRTILTQNPPAGAQIPVGRGISVLFVP